MRSQKLTTIILIGMVLGILVGWACNTMWPDPKTAKTIADYISLITDIFLRLIKMIIAPLVFSTLVVGIAHMGDAKAIGRIGGKALGWFVGASLVSLLLGMVLVNILQPGDNLGLPLPDIGCRRPISRWPSLSLKDFVAHLVPTLVRRGDGDQRDPADRGVLDVLRRRAARRWATRAKALVARHRGARRTSC